VSTILWALDIGSVYGILALFTNLLAKEERKVVAPLTLARYRRERNLELIAATAFFISAIPLFWRPASRFYFWIAPFIVRRGAWLLSRIGPGLWIGLRPHL